MMKKIAASLLCLSLASCASLNDINASGKLYEYVWLPPPGALKVNYITHDTPEKVHNRCLELGASLVEPTSRIVACAVTNPLENKCDVHVTPNPPDYIITHELLHCAGWSHIVVK